MVNSSLRKPVEETLVIDLMGFRPLISHFLTVQRDSTSIADKLRQGLGARFGEEMMGLRADAIAFLVADLVDQGWSYRTRGGSLTLYKPDMEVGSEKALYRAPLLRERDNKLREPSTQAFITRMERPRTRHGLEASVIKLIADGQRLSDAIARDGPNAVQPYLQIIGSGAERDPFTGLKLQDLWRYFRLTWTLPYRSTPGRKIYILVRDAGQPHHPLMGIAALGNSIVHIPSRDHWIGWTVESLAEQDLSSKDANDWSRILSNALEDVINGIYSVDLFGQRRVRDIPPMEVDGILNAVLREAQSESSPRAHEDMDWVQLAMTPLFRKKRAKALQRCVRAHREFLECATDSSNALTKLLTSSRGRSAVAVALEFLKSKTIGTNMMDIIVCGAVPPYNHLLGGKLVSLLMLDETVRKAYEDRYRGRASIIASGMSGRAVFRDSSLVLLGTTSLYHVGSSQYNRLQISADMIGRRIPGEKIGYLPVGLTEGYGSVYISDATMQAFQLLLSGPNGRVPVTNNFGEGTSPRMRLIRTGLQALGIAPDLVLKHNFKRIVYMVELAENARDFLVGKEDNPRYYFDGPESTSLLVDYWRNRWLAMRIQNSDVMEQVRGFRASSLLLSVSRQVQNANILQS